MTTVSNIKIGQILVENGVITSEQLDRGLREQKKTGMLICTALVQLGFASEEKVFSLLARQLNIPYVHLKGKHIHASVIQKVPAKFVSHYKVIPTKFENHCLTVAMADPMDTRILDDLRLFLELEVEGALASEIEIEEAIRKYYGVGAETVEKIIAQKGVLEMEKANEDAEDIESMANEASIIRFVNQVLSEAVKQRATDIHIEPFQEQLRVRFRIDGLLYEVPVPETVRYFQPAIVSRIKIMAKMNIADRRLPQDGRIKIKVNEEELDLRVSTIPTIFGESVQIRILSSGLFLEIGKLGLSTDSRAKLEHAIEKLHGIVFVTGPTGAGKSTTLYACLAKLNSSSVKIVTTEDPVEYQLRGINQIQVSPQIGLDFALALRHILRHDPDVIMIGEVRDIETAEIAIRSALTGHLVLSTLHTNDAPGAVTRLLDMGLEPFLVASSLECIVAQRLVRTVCPDCKERLSGEAKQRWLDRIKDTRLDLSKADFLEGRGCEACRFTGYRGRMAIHEVILMNEAIRKLIIRRASSQEIEKVAISQGMKTLREDGILKAFSGLTTLMEVFRVTQIENETASE